MDAVTEGEALALEVVDGVREAEKETSAKALALR